MIGMNRRNALALGGLAAAGAVAGAYAFMDMGMSSYAGKKYADSADAVWNYLVANGVKPDADAWAMFKNGKYPYMTKGKVDYDDVSIADALNMESNARKGIVLNDYLAIYISVRNPDGDKGSIPIIFTSDYNGEIEEGWGILHHYGRYSTPYVRFNPSDDPAVAVNFLKNHLDLGQISQS